MRVTVTTLHGGTADTHDGTFDACLAYLRLADPVERDRKDMCPLFQFADLGEQRSKRGSLRNRDNVLRLHAIVGDYDGGLVPMRDAVAIARAHDLRAAFYTTPSHTPHAPRWRVIADLGQTIAPSSYAHWAAVLNGLFGGILAPESEDYWRGFYYGRVRGVEYDHVILP